MTDKAVICDWCGRADKLEPGEPSDWRAATFRPMGIRNVKHESYHICMECYNRIRPR